MPAMPSWVTTSASSESGVSRSAAPSIIARTGVSIVPITAELVISAPSQCVKWMISGAAMPGNRYFVPPENPATSCGNTGPQIRTWSCSTASRLSATGTSVEKPPVASAPTSCAGSVPSSTNVDGSSHCD